MAGALARSARLLVLLMTLPAASAGTGLSIGQSPYLDRHLDDAIAWRPWSAERLTEARAQQRPLLLSSGYLACHWCHVIQQESYTDPQVGAVINRAFIPVLIDRELEPALDAALLEFLRHTRGVAGWPLHVILTPDGDPLLGFGYLPRTALLQTLQGLVQRWQDQPEALTRLARTALAEWNRPDDLTPPAVPLAPAQLDRRLLDAALAEADELAGGFGNQGKFPLVPRLRALLELQARQPDPRLDAFLRLTLEQIATGGLRDHLNGGFFRYTEDPVWSRPHFEKTLPDNALLLGLYLDAADQLGQPAYRELALETARFLVRELTTEAGCLASALSAIDTQGRDGGRYLWHPQTLAGQLSPAQRRLAARYLGLDASPDHPGGDLPRRRPGGIPESEVADWQALLETLRTLQRQRPAIRDEKCVLAWNGLALSALSRAASQARGTDRDLLQGAADRLAGWLRARTATPTRLPRALLQGRDLGHAQLDDLVWSARGLHDWGRLQPHAPEALGMRIDALIALAWQRHHRQGRWQAGAEPVLAWLPRPTALPDGPLPSPSTGLIALSETRLAAGADADRLCPDLQGALTQALPAFLADPLDHPGLLRWLQPPGH